MTCAHRLPQESRTRARTIRLGISNPCRTGYQNIAAIQHAAAAGASVTGGRRMNDQTPTSAERAEKLEGMGCKRKRVEDIRFVQGKGNYVDDLKLPGMLYGDFTRSPHAHARVKKIDTTKAAAVPGVVAVITAETLKTVNLAWMPTLAGDVQMVLADGKVLFQNQEVAFVIAEDRYTAADAAELVEVEFEGLPCNVDPLKAMAPNAPVIREDIKDKKEGAHGPRKHYNHVFNWQAGNKAAADAAFAKADVTIKEMIVYPRVHPCPLETCQCVASFDKIKGELTLWGTFQAPHVIRTVGSLISKIPSTDHISPESAAASATRSAPIRATSARRSPRSSPASR
jgi:carbon-monoxide dehydrogenase large subunit